MAGLPITIPLPAESATANYDWTDVASGLGYVTFYLCTSGLNGSANYELVDSSNYISQLNAGASSTSGTTYTTITFNTSTFNAPRTIGGTGYCQVFWSTTSASGGSVGIDAATFSIVSGGSETILSTFTGTGASSGSAFGASLLVPFTIAETNIKRGDRLRLNLRIGVTKTGASNVTGIVYTNPRNLTATLVPATNSNINIPFKIDL